MSLLRQIQDDAVDSTVSVPTLLRRCKILSARLGSEDFKSWIESELSGYARKEDLPDYRVLTVHSKGHFSGPYGSGIRNADIPLSCLPKDFREALGHSYLMQPVAAMESLAASESGGLLQEPWSPDLVAHFGQNIYQHQSCMQAWKVIPKSSLVAALDAVRTRVLNFVLEIEATNPDAGEAAPNVAPIPKEKVQQIFNTYITGTVQNLASGSTDVNQSATWHSNANSEILEKLLGALVEAKLPRSLEREATGIVEELRSSSSLVSFKERYQRFMSLLADHMQVLGPVVAPYLPALAAMVA
jgi:AbiTii